MLSALLLLSMPGAASGQRYHVHTYTGSDGLPSSLVFDLTEDASGRLWFATRAGVAVYDGTEWRSYHQAEGLNYPSQAYLGIDGEGGLWSVAGNVGAGLSRFDGETWETLPPYSGPQVTDNYVSCMVVDSRAEAVVAVGTRTGLLLYGPGGWRHLGPDEGLDGPVLALASGSAGLYVGARAGLFLIADPAAGGPLRPIPLPLPSRGVRGLAVEAGMGNREILWLAGRDWLGKLDTGLPEETFHLLEAGMSLPFTQIYEGLVLEPDRRGGLFFGNPHGLARFSPGQELEILDRRSGLVAGGATALHVDREGHLWVASRLGVSKVVSLRLATYDSEHGLLEDEVSAVLERASGQIVLGHNLGLTFLTPAGPKVLPLTDPNAPLSGRVLEMAEAEDGTLWIAAGALGFFKVDPGGRLHRFDAPEEPRYGASVLIDGGGRLWAASTRAVYSWQGERFVELPVAKPFPGIRRIFESGDGSFYLATSHSGVYVASRANPQSDPTDWQPIPNLEGESAFTFLEDHQGHRWIGTSSGLFSLEDDVARRVEGSGPATERPVYFLLQDRQLRLWLGTDNGVLRWDGRSLEHFTVDDGLSGRETNRAAALVDSRGQLWVGTDQGVSVYRREYDDPGLAPEVELVSLSAGGRTLALTDGETTVPIRLQHEENDLVLRFRAISFRDERRVRFEGRLEGFEPEPLHPLEAPRWEVRYLNLPPGRYRFHLRAANAEGVWSGVVRSAVLVISPPLWQRPWFLLSAALLGILASYGAQRYVAHRRYSGRLEAEVAQRTAELAGANRELTTLTQEKAEFLAIAAHDLRVPLVNLRGFAAEVGESLAELSKAIEPVLEHLGEAERRHVRCLLDADLPEELAFIDSSAARMGQLVTAILQLSRMERRELKIERLDMDDLVRSVKESLTWHLEKHPVAIQVGELPEVTADRLAMELVLQNLLGNAIAYLEPGRPGRIRVSGRRLEAETVIEVADNGRGIAEGDREKVFKIFGRAGRHDTAGEGMGLAYVRALLRRHGGRVWFRSELGRGTVFSFSLPHRPEAESG